MTTTPTPLQRRALELLDISHGRRVSTSTPPPQNPRSTPQPVNTAGELRSTGSRRDPARGPCWRREPEKLARYRRLAADPGAALAPALGGSGFQPKVAVAAQHEDRVGVESLKGICVAVHLRSPLRRKSPLVRQTVGCPTQTRSGRRGPEMQTSSHRPAARRVLRASRCCATRTRSGRRGLGTRELRWQSVRRRWVQWLNPSASLEDQIVVPVEHQHLGRTDEVVFAAVAGDQQRTST